MKLIEVFVNAYLGEKVEPIGYGMLQAGFAVKIENGKAEVVRIPISPNVHFGPSEGYLINVKDGEALVANKEPMGIRFKTLSHLDV